MTYTKGKYYYVRYAWDMERWKCVEVINGIPVFRGNYGLKTRTADDILGEVPMQPFPWRNLLLALAALTLAFGIGYVEGRLHTSLGPVPVEADK